MIRMFDRHSIRKQRELGGCWTMYRLSDKGEVHQPFSALVPSCWESMRGFEDFRGRCKYVKKIRTTQSEIRLNFKGISHTADVFFDGEAGAHHYNVYT